MAALRTCPSLLALILSTTSAASGLQLPTPSPPAGTGSPEAAHPSRPESFLPLARVHRDPLAVLGTRISVQATVVRTTRQTDPLGARLRLLLIDAHGDTISAEGPTELPPVGARVIVSGVVELDSSGIPIIGPEQGTLVVTVLDAPEVAVPAEDGCDRAPAGRLGGISCAAAEAASGPAVLMGGALLLVVLGVLAARTRRRWNPEEPNDEIALIVDLAGEPRTPKHAMPSFALSERAPWAPNFAAEPVNGSSGSNGTPAEPAIRVDTGPALRIGKVVSPWAAGVEGDERREEERPGAAIRDEDLLQLLPGRLEVLQGKGLDPEIRFFRASATEVPEITFGRAAGPLYRHVQLSSPGIARLHARLRYANRGWSIVNLSHANPVVLNGIALTTSEEGVALEDGDRIQIGDVVFRYHAGPR